MPEKRFEIEGLRQRLFDPSRGEEFVVYVEQNIAFYAGDFVSLLGPSGCGKTTLLSVLGLLRAPTDPQALKHFRLWVPEKNGRTREIDLRQTWIRNKRRVIESARRRHIGFALQSGELISSLTVRENIAAPLHLNGLRGQAVTQRVEQLIDAFRLRRRLALDAPAPATGTVSQPDKALGASSPDGATAVLEEDASQRYTSLGDATINRLSGGEYQRTALARAIAHRPAIAFVDEPTSALNRELARGSLELLRGLQAGAAAEHRGVVVMITHDEQFAHEFSNVIIRMAPRKNAPAGEVIEVKRLDETASPTHS
jgi:putative ABC transport system ATP-binding protein